MADVTLAEIVIRTTFPPGVASHVADIPEAQWECPARVQVVQLPRGSALEAEPGAPQEGLCMGFVDGEPAYVLPFRLEAVAVVVDLSAPTEPWHKDLKKALRRCWSDEVYGDDDSRPVLIQRDYHWVRWVEGGETVPDACLDERFPATAELPGKIIVVR